MLRALARGEKGYRPWELERLTVRQIVSLYSRRRKLSLDDAFEIAKRQRKKMEAGRRRAEAG